MWHESALTRGHYAFTVMAWMLDTARAIQSTGDKSFPAVPILPQTYHEPNWYELD